MTSPDVVVIGLGPAGASAARAAAQRGARVIAVDRRQQAGVPVQCAELVPRGLDLELTAPAAATRQFVARMATTIEAGAPVEAGAFHGRMLDRAAFDRELVMAARDAGVDCRFGIAARPAAYGGLQLSDGAIVVAPSLVAADGARSAIGRAAGIANQVLLETRQVTVPLTRTDETARIFLSARLPDGYGWLFPAGREARLGVGARRGAALKDALLALRRRLLDAGHIGGEIGGLTGGALPCGGLAGPIGRFGATIVLAAGDAAGLANPVSGAGIAAAIISGRLAGEAAARIAAGDPAAAEDYADEIEAIFGKSLRRALARLAERRDADGSAAAWRRSWIGFPEYWT